MVLGIQIVGVLFSLFMLYYTFLQFKRKDFTVKEFVFWFVLWILFIVFAVFPNLLNPILVSFDIGRKMDFFTIVGFFFLFGVTTYIYTIVREIQNKMEEVVSKLAVERAEKKEK